MNFEVFPTKLQALCCKGSWKVNGQHHIWSFIGLQGNGPKLIFRANDSQQPWKLDVYRGRAAEAEDKGKKEGCNDVVQISKGEKVTGECCQELAKGKGQSGAIWVNVQVLNIKVIAEFMSVRKKCSKISLCVSVWIFTKYMNYKISACGFCLPVESKINPRDTVKFDTG